MAGTTASLGETKRGDGTIVENGSHDAPPHPRQTTVSGSRAGTMSNDASQLASQQSAARSSERDANPNPTKAAASLELRSMISFLLPGGTGRVFKRVRTKQVVC